MRQAIHRLTLVAVLGTAALFGCSSSGAVPPPSDAGPSDAGTSTCTTDVGDGDRLITITSQCAHQTVVVGVNGGFVQDCAADGSCPAGTTCLTTRTPPGCFWDFPRPACGSPVLTAGDSVTYVLRAPPINYTIQDGPAKGQTFPVKWSGNVYASTHCAGDGTQCRTGVCSVSKNGVSSVQPCSDGVGPQGPVTLAEFTLSPSGADFYDISAINGVNVPIAMAPAALSSDPANPYTCQAAGGTTPSGTGLPACSWTFDGHIQLNGATTDASALLRAVTPGGSACKSDADCSGTQRCGSALQFGVTSVTQGCGEPLGWWTADELCVYTNNTMGAPVNCNARVPGQGANVDLYQCNGANPNSCYNKAAANSACCGCPDWTFDNQKLPVPADFKCYATNPSWQSLAEPWAAFVKKACPTAYSFPFDDATSTFTCAGTKAATNSMGYKITFCPGGKDGT